MSRPTKEERLHQVHSESLREFDKVQSALADERKQCLEDRRFYSIAGAQWEGPLGEQFENKPRFEVNKIHLAVIRIFNEYRNNRISVTFSPKDGTKNDELADTCAGLFRADEQDSGAQEAYDNGFEEGVGGGFGSWRLRAKYENEYDGENDKQRIRIEPIFDADSSVYFDQNAKRQDKADAVKCWVLTGMSRIAYEEAYPEDDPASWPKDVHQWEFDWLTPDTVFVAEYYQVEESSEMLHTFRGLDGQEQVIKGERLDEEEDLLDTLTATGFKEVKQRRVKCRKVHKYIMSGNRVLEDCGYIAGKNIPIVPVYGKRWFVDNVERCMGHVRLAKDAQRLANMQRSKLAEISALSSVEKPILTPEQVLGHQVMWQDDNVKNYPYLLINPITDANGQQMPSGPVAYTRAPNVPPAMAALLQITEQDLQGVLGNQQAGEVVQPNMSGKAIELVQNKLDMQAFIYMDNMAKAMKRCGEIWLDMAKELYTEEGRKMKTIGEANEVDSAELSRPMIDKETGEQYAENDLSEADFDVNVDVGPSSDSRRAATVRALTGMLAITQDPETAQVLSSMAIMNMEGEGISDVRNFFRQRMLRMGAVKPTDEEAQQLAAEAQQQGQNVDPQSQYLMAAAQAAEADAAGKRANTVLTIAKSEREHAETQKTLSEIPQNREKAAADLASAHAKTISTLHGLKQPLSE